MDANVQPRGEILIKNGTLVLKNGLFLGNLRIKNGKILEIIPQVAQGDAPNTGQNPQNPGAAAVDLAADLSACGGQVIDAAGMLVFPGFIDPHTHLDMDTGVAHTADNFAEGTRAALLGGTTTILDFATQARGGTLQDALAAWHKKADGVSACHYGFHMAITDWNPAVSDEMAALQRLGVTSYKLYMAYDALRVSDADAYGVLKTAAGLGVLVSMHCEDGDMVNAGIAAQRAAGFFSPAAHPRSRPAEVEARAVARWLTIAELADAPVYVVHLSTASGLEAARTARARGQRLYLETCPQYLLLEENRYFLPNFEGAKFVLSPPLRQWEDCASLWAAVRSGEIDTIGTDHCAFDFNGPKQLGRKDFSQIPNGIPGIEHRPALLYTYGVHGEKITPAAMAEVLAERPARLFGLYPRKGLLAVGSDADIVIWDGDYRGIISAATQTQRVDYTPYEGFEIRGRAHTVLLGGQVVVANGKLVKTHCGRYVSRDNPDLYRASGGGSGDVSGGSNPHCRRGSALDNASGSDSGDMSASDEQTLDSTPSSTGDGQ